MLAELRDGHVNLSASHDFGRYWTWHEAYPANFSDTLLRRYLGTDYKIASGLDYRILDDNIGYVRYESFSDGIGEGNLDEVLSFMLLCRGLIIDIRNNGGGDLTNAEKLAARFCQEKTLVGYIQHKTGKGHSDFSPLEPRYLEPSSRIRWHKPVCVLTNRHVYSAANEFVSQMKALPTVQIVGDRTGGGAGMPFSSSLPNGWTVRFSAVPIYDAQKHNTEFGIDPDYNVQLTDADFARGKDTIIEFARQLLAQ
jgi:C-terminal processing protease CtpA/Prc